MSLTKIENKLYDTFAPKERLVLMLEAMAREDHAEADRLRAACPRRTYQQSDADFIDRMTVAFDTAAVVCTDLQRLCGSLRLIYWAKGAVEGLTKLSTIVAEMAFHEGMGCMDGSPQSRFFAGKEKRRTPPAASTPAMDEEDDTDPAVGWDEVGRRAEAIEERAKKDGADVLALLVDAEKGMITDLAVGWRAFERFCLSRPGVDADTLLSAWKLPGAVEIREVLKLYPGDLATPVLVQDYFDKLCVLWDSRFGEREGQGYGH